MIAILIIKIDLGKNTNILITYNYWESNERSNFFVLKYTLSRIIDYCFSILGENLLIKLTKYNQTIDWREENMRKRKREITIIYINITKNIILCFCF